MKAGDSYKTSDSIGDSLVEGRKLWCSTWNLILLIAEFKNKFDGLRWALVTWLSSLLHDWMASMSHLLFSRLRESKWERTRNAPVKVFKDQAHQCSFWNQAGCSLLAHWRRKIRFMFQSLFFWSTGPVAKCLCWPKFTSTCIMDHLSNRCLFPLFYLLLVNSNLVSVSFGRLKLCDTWKFIR